MKNTKNDKKDKKVLIGALGIAAVIAAGSTFAWFTSSDEVTNRLTASADYGVSITETFTPPEEWLPGQEINKDVAAVNTGNLSALVKLEFEGALTLKAEGDGVAVSGFASADKDTLDKLTAADVASLQAGGYLAVAPEGVTTGIVGTDFDATDDDVPGLYLFRREIKVDDETTTYDYSGYYYDGDDYYGLQTIDDVDSDGNAVRTVDVLRDKGDTLTEADITGIKLKNFEEKVIPADDSQISWNYDKVYTDNVAILTYHPTGATNTAKDIVINVNLTNLGNGNTANEWQYLNEKGFYYTNDVEPGEATNKLIDSVSLDESVQAGAYTNMDFDLTVKLNSVQVTYADDSQTEGVDSASSLGASAAATNTGKEISSIKWS
ncbi:BsaA family SipW-dependent biofilm matrix protein [uncultured Ruminococcus sp.]|uniref:BsaA family SipW-dependent biofilm matrix protein n=1 Tax=uncultured Ruminococcus sp. TaxID=165186 RepID=UPI002611F083|nr:BsaA family SipW-dependent biofilm matrix protein [uncultured Ruminococcus sp.]